MNMKPKALLTLGLQSLHHPQYGHHSAMRMAPANLQPPCLHLQAQLGPPPGSVHVEETRRAGAHRAGGVGGLLGVHQREVINNHL